jgi:hypothetical protein
MTRMISLSDQCAAVLQQSNTIHALTMLPARIDRVIIDTSSGVLRYLLVTQTKQYIRISAYTYTLLVYVNSGMPFPLVAQKISADVNAHVTPDQVQAAYYNILEKIEKEVGDQQPFLYMQPCLWFGLLLFVIFPDTATLVLEENHVLPQGLIEGAIIMGSVIAALLCLGLGIYFWLQKRRRMGRLLPRSL